MTETHRIEFQDGQGKTVAITLEQEGGSFEGLFPVESISKVKWGFGEFGFGGLNKEFTLEIVDDDTNEFYDLFNRVKKQDIRVKIIVDGRLYTIGFPDYEQLATTPFVDGKRRINVKFYNNIGFMASVSRRQQDRIDAFQKGAEVGSGLAPGNMFRPHEILRSLFHPYGENIVYSHRWRQRESNVEGSAEPGVALQYDDTVYLIFNQLWFSIHDQEETFKPSELMSELLNLLSQSLWFKYGWSVDKQKPFVAQIDTGRLTGFEDVQQATGPVPHAYIEIELLPDVIGEFQSAANRTSITNNELVNEINPDWLKQIPELDTDKVTIHERDFTERGVDPYAEVAYENESDTHIEENPEAPDAFSDTYQSSSRLAPQEEYDELNPGQPPGVMAVMNDRRFHDPEPDPAVQPFQPIQFSDSFLHEPETPDYRLYDPHTHGGKVHDDTHTLSELSAIMHMKIRESIQRQLVFDYLGVLDPMLNYRYNGKAYAMIEGEYDVVKGVTEVSESISLFDL
jgi:hypothetical protein